MIQLRLDHLLILQTLAPNLSNYCIYLSKSLASNMLLDIIKMANQICRSFTSKFTICYTYEHRPYLQITRIIFTSHTYTTITSHLNTFSTTIVRLLTTYSILIWSPARNISYTSTSLKSNIFATTLYFGFESNMDRSFPPTHNPQHFQHHKSFF